MFIMGIGFMSKPLQYIEQSFKFYMEVENEKYKIILNFFNLFMFFMMRGLDTQCCYECQPYYFEPCKTWFTECSIGSCYYACVDYAIHYCCYDDEGIEYCCFGQCATVNCPIIW